MSSIISIIQNVGESYGGASQEVAKSIFYFLSQADATAGKTTYPLILPDSGTRYSYELWLRARVDLAPSNEVSNFKAWYVSGIPGTGVNITANSTAVSAYSAPSNLESDKGTRVDFTTKNSEVNSISLNGTLTNVNDYTSFLVLQLEVLPTASTGAGAVSWILQYDES